MEGAYIALVGGTRAERQRTVGRVICPFNENAFQFWVASLIGERRKYTQNNLRKAFDRGSAEHYALLYMDGLDALLACRHIDEDSEHAEDKPTPSIVEYFFYRMRAHPYLTVLGLGNPAHVDAIRRYEPTLIITHEGAGQD